MNCANSCIDDHIIDEDMSISLNYILNKSGVYPIYKIIKAGTKHQLVELIIKTHARAAIRMPSKQRRMQAN